MMTSPLKIQNVVSTISLKNPKKFDLRQISSNLTTAEYRPERFSAMIMREPTMNAVALLFSTGRLVCVGTKSVEASRLAIAHFANLITTAAKIPAIARLDDDDAQFTVRNMVASVTLARGLNLQSKLGQKIPQFLALYEALRPGPRKPQWLQYCSYNPECFPGMCLRLRERSGIVVLVFTSGKCVITGARSETEIHKTFETVYPIFEQHMK